MATISIRRAVLADAAEMAPRMRSADVEEIRASGSYTPVAALEDAIRMSKGQTWTVRCDGEIMGIWGFVITSVLHGTAIPWLLTSQVVDKHPKIFYRLSRDVVRALRRRFALMTNCVDQRHVTALRWAERLGFDVDSEAREFGVNGAPFIRIALRGDRHV